MKIGTIVAESNGVTVVSCGIYGYSVVDANGRDVASFNSDDDALACMAVVASGIAWTPDAEQAGSKCFCGTCGSRNIVDALAPKRGYVCGDCGKAYKVSPVTIARELKRAKASADCPICNGYGRVSSNDPMGVGPCVCTL